MAAKIHSELDWVTETKFKRSALKTLREELAKLTAE